MQFPKGFLFGATIGAHQVEGDDFASDWWRWEQRPARIRDGETSALGAGHVQRFRDDFALARKLGHNAVCISLSWPRIQPGEDAFDEAVLVHYNKVFESAREYGLTPLCVLHHVTVPVWFRDRGGWLANDAAALFQRYARCAAEMLGDSCNLWIPIYEPEHWLTLACREGRWPGAGGGYAVYGKNLRALADAQRRAARALREIRPEASIGVSVRGAIVEPMDEHSPWDTRAALSEQRRLNMRFIETLSGGAPAERSFDFVGLSYYGKTRVRFAPLCFRRGFALPVDARGGPSSLDEPAVYSDGLEEVLASFGRLGCPVYLSGLGIATEDDAARRRFIRDHVQTLLESMHVSDVVLDVRGMFYSSLLDGFEWQHGYTRRYGLVHVKHPGLARTPNQSAWFYKDIAEHGCIRPGALRQFCGDNQ